MTPSAKTIAKWYHAQCSHAGITPYRLAKVLKKAWDDSLEARLSTGRAVYAVMDAFDESMGTYGIEAVCSNEETRLPDLPWYVDRSFWGSVRLLYANTGDSYGLTLTFDVKQERFLFDSWGGWLERNEKRSRRAS